MAHERAPDEPLDAFLCRILLALARTTGGELRISESAMDIDTRALLLQDFDPKTNEIVFRVGSRYAQPIWVNPRSSGWTVPFAERAAELGLLRAQRDHVPTDEELAAKERAASLRKTHRPQPPIAG